MSEENRGELQKWSDVAMFKAEPINAQAGPEVRLLSCNNDPLGTIASAALMYEGKSVSSLAKITDDQRRYYLEQVQKSALAAPLEFVNFHFIISGVTRGFTHQMVRQRTATYTQESTRFAVKEDMPVGYPPSLDGTLEWRLYFDKCWEELYPGQPVELYLGVHTDKTEQVRVYAETNASKEQLWRREWDNCVKDIEATYNALISSGMPAEDARGLAPTNLLTRINYNTSLRGLLEHSGLRLCTQAQFEWRLVWTKIKEAIIDYPKDHLYGDGPVKYKVNSGSGLTTRNAPSAWQFEELAKIFKPICYQRGSCQFNADVDRACSIKGRVDRMASLGIPSAKWDRLWVQDSKGQTVGAGISDSEWMLDPSAARVSQ